MDSSSSSFLSLSFSPLLLYPIHTSIFSHSFGVCLSLYLGLSITQSFCSCISYPLHMSASFSSLSAYHSLFLHPTFFFFFFSFCYPVHLHSPALAAVFDSSLTFFLSLKDLPLSLSTHHTTVFTLHLGDIYTQHPHIYFSLKSSSLFVEITQSPNNCSM